MAVSTAAISTTALAGPAVAIGASAYAIAAGLDGALLIYAAGEGEPSTHTIVEVGKRIERASIDLTGTPDQILDEVDRVAGLIRSRLFRGVPNAA